jgi:DNA-binding transcriptional ArsR family regulator
MHKQILMKAATGSVFKAIADPTRRTILDLLSQSPQSVKELTSMFSMSQPAISQHLRELRNARLVDSEKVGLEQRYRLTAAPLKQVFDWSSKYRRFFDPSGHAWSFVASSVSPKSGNRNRGTRRHGS